MRERGSEILNSVSAAVRERLERLRRTIEAAAPAAPAASSAPASASPGGGLTPWSAVEAQTGAREAGDWLVEGLLRPGWLVAVIGHGKSGKSTLMLQLMAHLGAGAPWVGRPTRPCPTIYVDTEMPRDYLVGLIREVRAPWRFEYEPLVGRCRLPLDRDAREIRRLVGHVSPPGVLVIDAFRSAYRPDPDAENDAGVVSGHLWGLQTIARETGWTILLLHHFRKSGTGECLDAAGSGAWVAVPDAIWTWTRPAPAQPGVLRVTGRLAPVPDLHIELGPSVCERRDTEPSAEDALLACLPAAEGWTLGDLMRRPEVQTRSPRTVLRDLARLEARGLVARTGSGTRGDPYRYRASAPMTMTVRVPDGEPDS